MKNSQIIVLAGATGNLGLRIARELVNKNATVRALIRPSSARSTISKLEALGLTPVIVDFESNQQLTDTCKGASCVIGALAGMKDVIILTQSQLLNAAVAAKVPRFIPSDFSMEYALLPQGQSRNLSWRQEFNEKYLNKADIQVTSILCGPFTDVLTDLASILLPKLGMVLCWGENPDVKLDFTTMDDTAKFTACVALDTEKTPRYLRISGDELSTSDIDNIAGPISTFGEGTRLRVQNAGSLSTLSKIASIMRKFGGQNSLYPPWVGMEYMQGMYFGLGKLKSLDNERYPEIKWTKVQGILDARR